MTRFFCDGKKNITTIQFLAHSFLKKYEFHGSTRGEILISNMTPLELLQLRSNGLNPGVAMKGTGFGGSQGKPQSLLVSIVPCN